MSIHKVLIVDDSKTETLFMTDLLQRNGFAVRSAENATEAFARLAEDRPDLILMDVVMPGQNGFQLTRSISRTPPGRVTGWVTSPGTVDRSARRVPIPADRSACGAAAVALPSRGAWSKPVSRPSAAG